MEEIERATGLVGFIIVGGPELRQNGDIMVMSYVLSLDASEQLLIALRAQTGKVHGGLDFSESYGEWQASVEEPFVAHLNDVFCKGALLLFAHLGTNSPQAREDRLARALPKWAMRNTPALPPAESSRPPSNNFVSTASSKEVAEEESNSPHGPGSMVGAFSLGIKQGLMTQKGGPPPTGEDGATLLNNFMRSLRMSRLSEAASTNGP